MTLLEPVLRWFFKEDHSIYSYPSQQGTSFGQILALLGWPCEFKQGCNKYGYSGHKRCGHLRWIPHFRVDLTYYQEKLEAENLKKIALKLHYHRVVASKLLYDAGRSGKITDYAKCSSVCATCYANRKHLLAGNKLAYSDFLRMIVSNLDGYRPSE